MSSKIKSRKFWLSVAAFLASIGASLTGYFTDSEPVMIAGVICTMLSAAIYAAMEAFVDGKAAEANVMVTEFTENRSVSTSGNTASSIKAISDNFYVKPVAAGDGDAEA